MIHLLSLALTLFAALPLGVESETFTGEGTTYGDSVEGGNCGLTKVSNYTQKHFAALNNPQFDKFSQCGQCAEVRCTSPECQGRPSIIVQFTDRCPECKTGDIDFSNTGWNELTGTTPSRWKISWNFIACPKMIISGNVEYFMKEGSSPYWFAFQPRNALSQIVKMEVQGEGSDWITLEPPGVNYIDSYYFLGQVNGGLRLPFTIRSTSVDGDTIVDTYMSITGGAILQSKSQFKTKLPQAKNLPNDTHIHTNNSTTDNPTTPTGNSGTPTPTQTSTPSSPVGPSTPSSPAGPSTPSSPAGPSTPSSPAGPSTPSSPAGPSSPPPSPPVNPTPPPPPPVNPPPPPPVNPPPPPPPPPSPKPVVTQNPAPTQNLAPTQNPAPTRNPAIPIGPLPPSNPTQTNFVNRNSESPITSSSECPAVVKYSIDQWGEGYVMQFYVSMNADSPYVGLYQSWMISLNLENVLTIDNAWNNRPTVIEESLVHLNPETYNVILGTSNEQMGFIGLKKLGQQVSICDGYFQMTLPQNIVLRCPLIDRLTNTITAFPKTDVTSTAISHAATQSISNSGSSVGIIGGSVAVGVVVIGVIGVVLFIRTKKALSHGEKQPETSVYADGKFVL